MDNHRLSHAEVVNRRARFGILVVIVLLGMTLVVVAGGNDDELEDDQTVAAPTTTVLDASRQVASAGNTPIEPSGNEQKPQSPIDDLLLGITGTTLPLDPITIPPPDAPAENPDPTTTTQAPSSPTTTTGPPATTPPSPPTTTLPPPTTTLPPPPPTTTLPPPATTLPPPPTTTLPPPTTTLPPPPPEPPVVAFSPVLGASFNCDGEKHTIRWRVQNPEEAKSAGWTMVIESDSRGLFAGVALSNILRRLEQVDPGQYTLTVTAHWEKSGEPSTGPASASLSVDTVAACDD